MRANKHMAPKIALAALIVVILALIVGGCCMFGTQLKAVGTIEKLEEHLYAMEYRGDYGFDGFLAQGGGSEQSHQRFDRLTEQYAQAEGVMSTEQVRESLRSVSQGTFPDSNEKTQWSIVYNTSALTADYCFRENADTEYSTMLLDKGGWIYIRGD